MAIAYRSSNSASNSSSSSVVITKPSGTVDNDVMLAIINANNDTTITPPSGWNLIRSYGYDASLLTAKISTYYKVASSEGANYTFSLSGTVRNAGAISSFSGVKTSDPIDVENGRLGDVVDPIYTPSITTNNNNEYLVYLASFDDVTSRTFTPDAAMTEAVDSASASGCQIAYESFPTAGATGTRTSTLSSGGTWGAGFIVALEPEGGTNVTVSPSVLSLTSSSVSVNFTNTSLPTFYNRFKRNLFSGYADLAGSGSHQIKVALLSNTYTYNADHNTFGQISSNEVSGTGYTAGGTSLSGFTITQDNTYDLAYFSASSVSWTTASFTARYVVIYDNTLITKDLIMCIDLGSNLTVNDDTFLINWGTNGVIATL